MQSKIALVKFCVFEEKLKMLMVFMIVLQKAFSIGADRGTQRLAGSITLLQF